MGETRYEDRMSDSDALTWSIERDPQLRSTILAVWVLDGLPDLDRLRSKFTQAASQIPRLHQRVVEDPVGIAPPRWENAALELDYHMQHVRVPGRGTRRDLLELAEPIAMAAFDRDRPLWQTTLVEGLEDGGAAVILKIHHAISDGVGLVRMTERLIERSPDGHEPSSRPAIVPPPDPEPWSSFDETLDALRFQASRRIEQGKGAASAVLSGLNQLAKGPRTAIHDARELAASAGRLLAPIREPMSPIMTGRSTSLRLACLSRPLDDLRRAGKNSGGTVNDVFVAGMAGGLRRYHEHHGAPVDELRMSMPINMRHGENARQAGNQFAPVRFPVPVSLADPLERIREIGQRVLKERAEPSLPALDAIASALGRLPAAAVTVAFGGMMKAVDFLTSNVPGPPFPVYACGSLLREMIPFGPLTGAAANLTLFSYDGQVAIGVTTDRAAVPDPEVFVRCLEEGLDEVLHAAGA